MSATVIVILLFAGLIGFWVVWGAISTFIERKVADPLMDKAAEKIANRRRDAKN